VTKESVENRINKILDKVRPYVQMHGGDVQFLRMEEDGVAVVKIFGACVGCSLANETYNKTIGPLLIKEIEEVNDVEFE
jgi:Fe-S cluster biogenesis protein NfuA